jgi:hypothetical protein
MRPGLAVNNSRIESKEFLVKTKPALRFLLFALFVFSCVVSAQAQSNSSRMYRGSIGDKRIEMRLTLGGDKVTGTYFYDQFKQDIKLEGTYDAKGQLELTEGTGKRKTGKFVCLKETETPDTDLECEWSRPDGTGKALVFLNEQGISFKTGTKIVPKLIRDQKTKAEASYPQLTVASITSEMVAFNQLVESRVQKAIKDFDPETISKSSFDTNYNVMFGNDDIVSVEMIEYSDVGATHPNTRLWTVNYNLKTNKELTLEDVFKPGDEYKTALAEFVTDDINRRADKMEEDEARRNKRQPEKRDEPVMAIDRLPEMDTWALSPKGFVVYFDFPHVMAVFDKTVVPYSVLARYFKSDGVAPLVK